MSRRKRKPKVPAEQSAATEANAQAWVMEAQALLLNACSPRFAARVMTPITPKSRTGQAAILTFQVGAAVVVVHSGYFLFSSDSFSNYVHTIIHATHFSPARTGLTLAACLTIGCTFLQIALARLILGIAGNSFLRIALSVFLLASCTVLGIMAFFAAWHLTMLAFHGAADDAIGWDTFRCITAEAWEATCLLVREGPRTNHGVFRCAQLLALSQIMWSAIALIFVALHLPLYLIGRWKILDLPPLSGPHTECFLRTRRFIELASLLFGGPLLVGLAILGLRRLLGI